MATIPLAMAQQLIAEAQKTAGDKPIVVAVVDSGGDLIALQKMDRTRKTMGRVAIAKAYTAAVSGRETTEVAQKARENPVFWQSVANKDPGPFIFARGGAPLIHGDEVVGAVGISGPSGDLDVACARAAAALFTRLIAEN